MKFNLKNKPDWSTKAQQEWFEGFEKELREAKRQLNWVSKKQGSGGRLVSEGIIHFIEEILGE